MKEQLKPNQKSNASNSTTGRPEALAPEDRRLIVRLVRLGCSRRIAARHVGCSHSTITRTAGRDPDFSRQLLQAEAALEVEMLTAIHNAAKNERHWRAAAWLLERKNPRDYAPPPEPSLSPTDVVNLFMAVLDSLRPDLAATQIETAISRLTDLLRIDNPN